MRCSFLLLGIALFTSISVFGQQTSSPESNDNQASSSSQSASPSDSQKTTARDAEDGESSSRETRIDIRPPANDVKDHPESAGAVAGTSKDENSEDAGTKDVQEMHPFDPHRAINDDEVGDYYYKLGNYKGALARYQDALVYKDRDAVANFKMAQCYEKLNQPKEAVNHYREYLKILPNGQYAKAARKALQKLGATEVEPADKPKS
ncbi:MAG TPA: tetratricopeptide repeat protein [Terriglobales bacterium]